MAAKLHSNVISDVLDRLGQREHAMDPSLRPLRATDVIAGIAVPVRIVEISEPPEDAYAGEIAALDALRPDDVAVLAAEGTARSAIWGELFSTAARARGARGTIADGFIRDQKRILKLAYPVWSRGSLPLDNHGRTSVTAHHVEAVCGGVRVRPGDIVFADMDGIVVIPPALAEETCRKALEKVSGESLARAAIRRGVLVRAAYDRYGVL